MAHTYYSRLTIVHPKKAPKMDPRLGIVIAETATTGRFIIADIAWESAVAPNANTTVAFHATGDIKIYEPLGMGLFDYIRASAWELGIDNHLDARFFLEIELLSENNFDEDAPFKYIWPIMMLSTESKGTFTEKGAEYNMKFVHTPYHAQTDLVQPLKDMIKIECKTLGEYFDLLAIELEKREYKYAAARQKAGSPATPGGPHPAMQDDYHDEYHFILEPRLRPLTFTTKGPADNAIQGSWFNFVRTNKIWNITARPGTTIVSWITRVLQGVKDIADLIPGKPYAQTDDATGSTQKNKDRLKEMLNYVYQFFRVETHTVYKSYDYIRGRYAAKYVFLIYLADQPNMYQYPDEINLLNNIKNKDKVQKKLVYYIQEGLLRKVYYHLFTGLNTDILKVDLTFNHSYSLPSFPVVWADRGETSDGKMNLQNYNKRISPFVHRDNLGVARREVAEFRAAAVAANNIMLDIVEKVTGSRDVEKFEQKVQSGSYSNDNRVKQYLELKKYQATIATELKVRDDALSATDRESSTLPTINKRSDLLDALKGYYAEDIDFNRVLNEILENNYPNLRPRMEPDHLTDDNNIKEENERLMEKIFSVILNPRDLIELDLEILGDPFWLGVPNLILQGEKSLEKIELPSNQSSAIKSTLDGYMKQYNIDPDWGTKEPVWGDYGTAQWYKGAPLFLFQVQVPDSRTDGDILHFNTSEQIIGIYLVKSVTNEFKDGRWVQKLKSVKDLTIPSFAIPRGLTGELEFEEFMNTAIGDDNRVADEIEAARQEMMKQRNPELRDHQLTGDQGMGPAGVENIVTERGDRDQRDPKIVKALEIARKIKESNPPPMVGNPAHVAQTLVDSGNYSKDEAYNTAYEQYKEQVKAKFQHNQAINEEAYKKAGVDNYRPYSADTLTTLAIQRSGAGGLNDWKNNNTQIPGPAALNNPMDLGRSTRNNTTYKYNSFDEGLEAGDEYYNYTQGVRPSAIRTGVGSSTSKYSYDTFLLPKNKTSNSELDWITVQTNRRGGKG